MTVAGQLRRLVQDLEETTRRADWCRSGDVSEDPDFVLELCGLKMTEAAEVLCNVARIMDRMEDDGK